LLAESILLSAISGAVALISVALMKTALLKLALSDLPRVNEVALSPGVLLFAFFVSILTGVIFGPVPALQTVRPDQAGNLREGSRGSGSSQHQIRISRILVSSEIALSLLLLIGAGLLLRSFRHLLEVRPGFEPHRLMTAKIPLPLPNDKALDAYRVTGKRAAFYQEVLRRVSALAGVEQAAMGSDPSLPMNNSRNQTVFVIENRATESERVPVAEAASVSSSYFDVLKTPLKRGRVFTELDNPQGQQAAVINEALARRYWPGADPVGQRIKLGRTVAFRAPSDLTIVGVVGDIRSDGLNMASAPCIYVSEPQAPPYVSVVYLRTGSDPGTLGEAIRREVQVVDPGVPVYGIRTMDDVVARNLSARRFALELLGVFAAVAFLLAAIGIYGVMAYTFSRRIGEIRLRVALGAQRSDILKIVLGEGARMVFFGVAAGPKSNPPTRSRLGSSRCCSYRWRYWRVLFPPGGLLALIPSRHCDMSEEGGAMRDVRPQTQSTGRTNGRDVRSLPNSSPKLSWR
jgi:putative ABC transport system permease protein